ncbi:hypothetical protein [Acinetobacter nosocomialis]|uniref:hypothetical protein n=1 Tax=Acinetobacter nosocomialis TaxID=106654 RepID=UPI0033ACACE9
MKKALFALAVLFLAGCKPETSDETNKFVLPPELKDCRVYDLYSSTGASVTAVRCPNSSTSTEYRVGKSTRTSIVVDGETYILREGAK